MFTFTISTAHAKDLIRAWAFLTPEEEEAVLALEGPERTEMVHKIMAQNFMPGAWVLDLKNNFFGPTDRRSQLLLRLQNVWGKGSENESLTWWYTKGEEVHEGAKRAMKRLNERAEANMKARPEFRSLRAKLNRTKQAAKQAKAACRYCQEAEEKLYQLRTSVDDWNFPAVGPEALEAARLQRQINFCSCTSRFETKIENIKEAMRNLELDETRKVLATAKDKFGLWKPEFTEPEPEPTEEPDWGLY